MVILACLIYASVAAGIKHPRISSSRASDRASDKTPDDGLAHPRHQIEHRVLVISQCHPVLSSRQHSLHTRTHTVLHRAHDEHDDPPPLARTRTPRRQRQVGRRCPPSRTGLFPQICPGPEPQGTVPPYVPVSPDPLTCHARSSGSGAPTRASQSQSSPAHAPATSLSTATSPSNVTTLFFLTAWLTVRVPTQPVSSRRRQRARSALVCHRRCRRRTR